MGRVAWNGGQEWKAENLEWHGVGELWVQVERHQGHLLLHKQFLSAFSLKEITWITNAVRSHTGSAPNYTIPLFAASSKSLVPHLNVLEFSEKKSQRNVPQLECS